MQRFTFGAMSNEQVTKSFGAIFCTSFFTRSSCCGRRSGRAITPDDAVWYTDHARGYIGRVDSKTGKPRQLHIEQSLECTNLALGPCDPVM